MREKTGYYDRNGKEIRDGDKIKGILGGQIYKGFVCDSCGDWWLPEGWYICTGAYYRFSLADLDDIEILEEE